MEHFIITCSPNGSTRHVAEVIAQQLASIGHFSEPFDLGNSDDRERWFEKCRDRQGPSCLWVGSPVYVDHPVPPVERFLSALTQQKKCYAVPFVTWGGVNSGVALHEMGSMLAGKGCIVLGAAKVMAVHSSMWRSENPLGAGHPDQDDDSAVRGLVDQVVAKLANSSIAALPLAVLDYQPQHLKEESQKKSIAMAKQMYPELAADPDKCTQCAECVEHCPAGAISLDPFPRFSDECFLCFQCVRICPEQAIPMDMTAAEQRIRGMADAIKEQPATQIFV